MNRQDERVLRALSPNNGNWYCYLAIVSEELDMPHREVRVRARRLARQGYATIVRLFNENDGFTAGSTYVSTPAGRAALGDQP